jgi:DNA excision repair protein ERCC-4
VHPGANTVLVMCQGERTCTQLREYLSTMKPFVPGGENKMDEAGRKMMARLLRTYFFWKNGLRDISQGFKKGQAQAPHESETSVAATGFKSPARGGNGYQRGGQPPNKRRRVRASSVAASVADRNRQRVRTGEDKEIAIEVEMEEEAGDIADL